MTISRMRAGAVILVGLMLIPLAAYGIVSLADRQVSISAVVVARHLGKLLESGNRCATALIQLGQEGCEDRKIVEARIEHD